VVSGNNEEGSRLKTGGIVTLYMQRERGVSELEETRKVPRAGRITM